MTAIWGKVYGSLHSSVKWQRATKGARALWVSAFSWSIAQGTDGFIPADVLKVLDGRKDEAAKLAEVGLWEPVTVGSEAGRGRVEGESSTSPARVERESEASRALVKAESKGASDDTIIGWRFHDWLGHNHSDQRIQGDREATRLRVQKHRNGVTSEGRNALHVTPRNAARTEQNRTEEEGGSSHSHQERIKGDPPQLETSIPSHVIPASWGPTTRHKAYAMEHNLRIAREVEKFRGNARASRKARIDWDAEFDAWLARSAEMTEGRVMAANEKRPGSSVWDRVIAND